MARPVLGKRTRNAPQAKDTTVSTRTRSKGSSQFVILDESENQNPFVTPSRKTTQLEESTEIEELQEEQVTPTRNKRRKTAPASAQTKHGERESRDAPTPPKITSHFKSTKVASTTVAPASKPAKVSTPRTPRHRDALSKKVTATPRHRVLVPGKPLTPRTPHTPTTPRNTTVTVYNEARQLFAKGNASTLYGRENERKELENFLGTRIESQSSGCIYVSGPPGTGKSAFVGDVSRKLEQEGESIKTAYINCMSMRSADDVYRKLFEELCPEQEEAADKPTIILEGLFYTQKSSYLVTLDEIDHLLDLDLELLYTLFEWALDPESSLILIGIANALDLTDRFLPRLRSRGLNPQRLPFLPYTAPQIASVVTSKLKSLSQNTDDPSCVPFIHPTAIQFLSKKVSAQTGDIRKSFDICRRAIDLIEAETRDKALQKTADLTASPLPSPSKTPNVGILVENMNLSSPAAPSPKKSTKQMPVTGLARNAAAAKSMTELTITTAPRATIAHMSRITATIFSNGTTQRISNLNLQQKAVLCALSALEDKKRAARSGILDNPFISTPSKANSSAPTIKGLYEAYAGLCKRDNLLHPLTSTEFRDVIGGLEALGTIAPIEGKNGSFAGMTTPSKRGRGAFGTTVEERKIASSVGKKELEGALEGVGSGILKGLLRGEGL